MPCCVRGTFLPLPASWNWLWCVSSIRTGGSRNERGGDRCPSTSISNCTYVQVLQWRYDDHRMPRDVTFTVYCGQITNERQLILLLIANVLLQMKLRESRDDTATVGPPMIHLPIKCKSFNFNSSSIVLRSKFSHRQFQFQCSKIQIGDGESRNENELMAGSSFIFKCDKMISLGRTIRIRFQWELKRKQVEEEDDDTKKC